MYMSVFYGYEEVEESNPNTDNTKLPLSGGTMTGNITMGNNDISNVKRITFSDTVDNINFNNKQLKNISAATDAQDPISKAVLDYSH